MASAREWSWFEAQLKKKITEIHQTKGNLNKYLDANTLAFLEHFKSSMFITSFRNINQ